MNSSFGEAYRFTEDERGQDELVNETAQLTCTASADGVSWTALGGAFDAGRFSDEHCRGLGFTGTFIGVCTQDLSGRSCTADFANFDDQAQE